MAEVVRYVDPDATGAGDGTSWTDAYTSLSAWNAGEATNLVTDGDWHHVYCRSSSGTADTTGFTITGWTTGASNYILIEAAENHEAIPDEWDATRYRLSPTSATAIQISEEYVRILGLQLSVAANNVYCVRVAAGAIGASNDIRVLNCRCEGVTTAGSGQRGITIADADVNLTVENTVVLDMGGDGINVNCSADIYNCVVYNSGFDGIEYESGGSGNVTNCAVFDSVSGDDFDIDAGATVTISNCASDDGTGTNPVSPSGGSWSNEFTDYTNGDFTILGTGNLWDGGTPVSGITHDMIGNAYDGTTPSIGVVQFQGDARIVILRRRIEGC